MSKFFKRALISSIGGFFVLWLIIAISTYLVCRFYYYPEIEKSHQYVDMYLESFVDDLEYLEKSPHFQFLSKRERNLEEFYLNRMGVLTSNTGMGPGVPDEYESLKEKFLGTFNKPENWGEILKDKEFSRIDLDWVKEVLDYDHWNNLTYNKATFLGIQAYSKKNNLKRLEYWSRLPIPNFKEMQFVSTLYAFKQIAKSNTENAFKLVDHLSFVYFNSSSLVGQMMVVSNMNLRNSLIDHFELNTVEKIPEEFIKRLKRSSYSWPAVFRRFSSEPFPQNIVRHIKPGTNACGGVFEFITGDLFYSDLLGGQFPLEFNLRESMDLEIQRKKEWFKICDLEAFDSWLSYSPPGSMPWFSRDFSQVPLGQNLKEAPLSFNKGKLPYIRAVTGMILYTISAPNFMKLYSEHHKDVED